MNQQYQDPPDPTRDPEDELSRLLAAAARGDAQAFESFYDATVGDALALAAELGGAPLEDVLTATYLQAWRNCALRDPAQAGALPWLLSVVREQAGQSSDNTRTP